MNLTGRLTLLAQDAPHRPAIILPDRVLNFAELDALVWKAAALLHGQGIRRGAVVAARFEDELTYLLVTLGVARLGAAIYSLPMQIALTQSKFLNRLAPSYFLRDKPVPPLPGIPSLELSEALIEAQPFPQNETLLVSTPDLTWLIASGSGSTGAPKTLALTHAQSERRMLSNNLAIALTPDDRFATFLAFDFAAGKQRYIECLCGGVPIVLFDKDNILPSCADLKVSVLYATPMHAERILELSPPPSKELFARFRVLWLSTSFVSNDLRRRVLENVTKNLYVRYGSNETSYISTLPPEHVLSEGSVGRPQQGNEIVILDRWGREVPAGTVGLIAVKTPGMISSYLDDPVNTQRSFLNGWFLPGDVGKIDANGELIHYGRGDQMMIFNGINIYPLEIENALAAHPNVTEAVAFPLKHKMYQDVPVCAVSVRRDGSVTEGELLSYARSTLGARSPHRVFILETIPRNQLGKLVRKDLYEEVKKILAIS